MSKLKPYQLDNITSISFNPTDKCTQEFVISDRKTKRRSNKNKYNSYICISCNNILRKKYKSTYSCFKCETQMYAIGRQNFKCVTCKRNWRVYFSRYNFFKKLQEKYYCHSCHKEKRCKIQEVFYGKLDYNY